MYGLPNPTSTTTRLTCAACSLPSLSASDGKTHQKIATNNSLTFLDKRDPKEGEPDNTAMLRAVVLGRAGGADDPKVIEEAKRRFAAYLKGDAKALPADIRFTAYSLVSSFVLAWQFCFLYQFFYR